MPQSTWEELNSQREALFRYLDVLDDFGLDFSNPVYRAVSTHAGDLFSRMEAVQPWTSFSTCSGGSVIAIEANPSVAAAVMSHELRDPFGSCGQCGDSSWIQDEYYGPAEFEVSPTATVIDAATVDEILLAAMQEAELTS